MSQNLNSDLEFLVWPLEGLFLLHCITEFLVEYKDENGNEVIDLSKIALRYFKGEFASDFITLIPF